MRKDGEVDGRTQQQFAGGKVDPVEAGKKGGQQSGTGDGPSSGGSSENNPGAAHVGGEGLRKDGQPDQRLKMNQ